MKITRDVIADLWPVFASGEGSPDTKRLVEQFIERDPEFGRLLRDKSADELLKTAAPALPPDHEVKALNRTKKVLLGTNWLFFCALGFSLVAFGRIVSDTTWSNSPKPFIGLAVIAAAFWIVFLARLAAAQRKALARHSGKA
jgi:hypothetical protein